MALAPVDQMDRDELIEYIEKLEDENRDLRGKTNNRPKLTEQEVREIRAYAESGMFSFQEIADYYGINPETVRRTVNRTYHASVS